MMAGRFATLLAAGLLLAGCKGFVPQPGPAADPDLAYLPLTLPIIALADSQEHESTGFPMHDNAGAVDEYVEVAQRPPEQPLFGRRILEWAMLSVPDAPVLHLGDMLDMSCESEAQRIRHVLQSTGRPVAALPGNHDGLMFGIFNYNFYDSLIDPDARRWDRACRRGAEPDSPGVVARGHGAALTKREFIVGYLAGISNDPRIQQALIPSLASERAVTRWINPDRQAFVEAIEAHIVNGRRYANSFILQRLRPPMAPGAPRRTVIIGLDTNQVGFAVSTWDTLRGNSPGTTGNISGDQLAVVERWIEAARRDGEIVILAGHHNWNQLSPLARFGLSRLLRRLEHPAVYLSAHTHRGFWAQHVLDGRRPLLELNVSSLSDWPIAFRRVSFAYAPEANRILVRGELLPRLDVAVGDDEALLEAWRRLACSGAMVAPDKLDDEDRDLVLAQRASRESLIEWLIEGLGEGCEACMARMLANAQRYQDLQLEALLELRLDLGERAHRLDELPLPADCGERDLYRCVGDLLAERPSDLAGHRGLFRRKAKLVARIVAHIDRLDSNEARDYMACRAVLAAHVDFVHTPDDRNAHRSEAKRRSEQFFRGAASVGMD